MSKERVIADRIRWALGSQIDTRGVKIIEDKLCTMYFGPHECHACILGPAIIGRFGSLKLAQEVFYDRISEMDTEREQKGEEGKTPIIEILEALAECPLRLARDMQRAHLSGMEATIIARRLNSGLPLV